MPTVHAFIYHSAPRPEVLKPLSGAVIASFTVLKHSSSAVIAFYKKNSKGILYPLGDTSRDTYSTTRILYSRTGFTSESCAGVQYSLRNLVWGYNNLGIPDSP